MTVQETVYATLRDVAREQEKTLPELADDLVLLESGLDSLGFAILVVRLEAALGHDPFATQDDIDFPVTLGDLVSAYETAAPADAAG